MASNLDLNPNILLIYSHSYLLFQLKLLKKMATPKIMQAKLSLSSQQVISGKAKPKANTARINNATGEYGELSDISFCCVMEEIIWKDPGLTLGVNHLSNLQVISVLLELVIRLFDRQWILKSVSSEIVM